MFFFLVLKYGIKYHFATNIYFSTICFSSIQKAPIGILSTRPLVFQKITAPEMFAKFPAKRSQWSPFLVHSQTFLGDFKECLEQLLRIELATACLGPPQQTYSQEFSRILKARKAGDCNLRTFNLL